VCVRDKGGDDNDPTRNAIVIGDQNIAISELLDQTSRRPVTDVTAFCVLQVRRLCFPCQSRFVVTVADTTPHKKLKRHDTTRMG
jgi:hypothetical protein